MLHRLLPWLGRSYNDAQLAFLARITVAEDALLADVTLVSITSAHGVIRLKGSVPQSSDKGRIEGAIRAALHTAGMPYARLVNALYANEVHLGHRHADQRTTSSPQLSARGVGA